MAPMLAGDDAMSRKDDNQVSPYLRRSLRSHDQYLRDHARRGSKSEAKAPPKEPRPAPNEGLSDLADPEKKRKSP